MGYYPIFLDLRDRPCVVVGGGVVATRKAEALLDAGARVTVVSPAVGPEMAALVRQGKLRYLSRPYRDGDLTGHQLAFVATDDPEVSAAVFREGRQRAVWVNAADDPARCDFILPGVVQRGDLVVAVSTGGTSPALTRAVRDELEAYFTADYALLTEVAADVRRELRSRALTPDGAAWREALDGELRRLVAEGRREEARAHLLRRLGG